MDKFIIRLDQQDLVALNEALGAQPLAKVVNVFLRIQQQVAEQTQPQQSRPPEKSTNGAHATPEE